MAAITRGARAPLRVAATLARRVGPAGLTGLIGLTGLGLLASPAVRADDIDAGRDKSRACAVCHGPLGVAVHPEAPNLAGQPADYLATQLRAYRSGARKHEVMSLMARPLSDDDIRQMAAWFSAVRIEATAPR